MARGVRLPRTAGRPPRFLRTGHRRATSLNEAHLQAAQRDARHTLGREAEGVLQSLLFHRASRGLRAQRATFRVLAEGDPDVDATLASAVSCPPPRSLTPPRPPLSDQRARAARLPRCPDCPNSAVRVVSAMLLLLCLLLRSSWLTVEGGGHAGAAGVLHRGRWAAVAVSVDLAGGVRKQRRWRVRRARSRRLRVAQSRSGGPRTAQPGIANA